MNILCLNIVIVDDSEIRVYTDTVTKWENPDQKSISFLYER